MVVRTGFSSVLRSSVSDRAGMEAAGLSADPTRSSSSSSSSCLSASAPAPGAVTATPAKCSTAVPFVSSAHHYF